MTSAEDEYMLNALTESIFRILVKIPPENDDHRELVEAMEDTNDTKAERIRVDVLP